MTLDVYSRLRPDLNAYHAVLHEAGALLVSAELHDGWLPERVRAASGEIVPPVPWERSLVLGTENHAVLIVGYTAQGFLVLNSWGRDGGRDRRVDGDSEHPPAAPSEHPGAW